LTLIVETVFDRTRVEDGRASIFFEFLSVFWDRRRSRLVVIVVVVVIGVVAGTTTRSMVPV